jgi:DNA-binding FadR family transcriptional regulator
VQIEQSIRNGKLKSGEQLPAERALAQEFGVSRTAMRDRYAKKDSLKHIPAAAPSSQTSARKPCGTFSIR